MFFNHHRNKKNGELTDTDNGWQVLMPSLAVEKLENIELSGREAGRSGMEPIGKEGLTAAMKLKLINEKLQGQANYPLLQKKIAAFEKKLNLFRERIEQLRSKVQERRERVRLMEASVYTIAAVIYILGDLVFSHQLILENWGLGRSEPYVWLPLVLALGMAPVFGKLVYARFIEARYDENAKVQARIVRWFFLAATALVVLSFLYFGYVRGIGFKFQILETGQDVYEALYQAHPHLNTIAFIALALLFLVGGAVLLTVGLNGLTEWFRYREDKKELKELEVQEHEMESSLYRFSEESYEVEALNAYLDDARALDEIVAAQGEFYSSIYKANCGKGMKEMLTDVNDEQSLNGKFHLFVRKALEQMVINSTIRKGHQNDQ